MASGRHETIRVRPDRLIRVETQESLTDPYATSAIAITALGWPEFAGWIASIESVRIVLMQS